MATRLPLNALHVFCVVAREGGFRQAAHVMHITPGAVSRQISTLEEHLKQTLFERGAGSAAALTPAGRRLHERAADRMAAITELLEEGGRPGRTATILIDTSVTLAMHWLIPQLRYFSERHPGIHVQVRTVDGDIDPVAPVDVFIRREVSELRGLPSRMFMVERSVLVAGSSFMAPQNLDASGDMKWLRRVTRIGTRSRPDLWPRWSEAHGLNAAALEPILVFDNTVLAIQATLQGLGVLVVPELFIAEMLAIGTLRRLHAKGLHTGAYSFAIGRQRESLRVALFTEWLIARAGHIDPNESASSTAST